MNGCLKEGRNKGGK